MLYIVPLIIAPYCNLLLKNLWLATLASTITSTMIIWGLFANHFGTFDAYFYKNLAITSSITFVISLIIGIIIHIRRKRKNINEEI